MGDFTRDKIEEVYVLEGRNNCKDAEEARESLEVEILNVFSIRRNDDGCDESEKKGNHHHDVLLDKSYKKRGVSTP